MAVTALPINASAGAPAYSARQTRQVFSALMLPGAGPLRARSGFRPGGAPTVSVTSTTWSVGPFSAVLDAGVSTTQGPYLVASDGTDTGSITPADGTFARKDILYVQLDDTDEDGSGQRRARPLYLAGTPAASPTAPGTPVRSLLIGTIDVPKVGAGSPVFTPSRLTAVAAGGIVPVWSQSERDALAAYPGLAAVRVDLSPPVAYLHDGATWQPWYKLLGGPPMDDTVLGETQLGKGLPYTIKSNTTNARADIDPGLVLTFVAPDTGNVWIELEGMCASTGVTSATGVFGAYWCLKDNNGGGLVTDSTVAMLPTQDTNATRLRYSAKIIGLTPGQTYNYTWQHFRGSGGTGTSWFYFGGGTIVATMRARRAA